MAGGFGSTGSGICMLLYVNLKMASEPYLDSFIYIRNCGKTPNKSGLFRSADFLLSIVILPVFTWDGVVSIVILIFNFREKMEW